MCEIQFCDRTTKQGNTCQYHIYAIKCNKCDKRAYYGYLSPLHCSSHKDEDEHPIYPNRLCNHKDCWPNSCF